MPSTVRAMPSLRVRSGIALTAQRSAVPRPHPHGEIDRFLLPLDLPPPLVGSKWVKSGEKHIIDDDLPGLAHRPDDRLHVFWREAAEEPVVVLDTFAAEGRGVPDPLLERHAPVHELVEKALRKHADTRRHVLLTYQLGGAPTGYCSRSVTAPVMSALSSEAK